MPLARFIRDRYWPAVSANWTPEWQQRCRFLLGILIDDLGARPINVIKPEDIEVWWGRQRARYRQPETATKLLARVKHVFRTAQRWGYIDSDPTAGLRAPKKGKGRVVWFTPEQRELILASANANLRPYVLVGMFTGARRHSMIELRKGDVDLDRNTVTFRATKNGDDVIVPLHPRLREGLAPLVREGSPEEYLLPRYTPASLSQAFKRLLVRLGLPQSRLNVSIHALRHDVGSHLGMAGANTRTIMDVLGHRDPRMSARYTHLSQAAIQKALEAAL